MSTAKRWSARASTRRPERSNIQANALYMTTDAANLSQCKHMLLHLTSKTWTRGDESDALGQEVEMALSMGVHVLLAHEMAGVGGQEARCGCEFSIFFACAEGATPGRLPRPRAQGASSTPPLQMPAPAARVGPSRRTSAEDSKVRG